MRALFEFYLSKDWQNHSKRLLWQLLYDRYEGQWLDAAARLGGSGNH